MEESKESKESKRHYLITSDGEAPFVESDIKETLDELREEVSEMSDMKLGALYLIIENEMNKRINKLTIKK